MIKKIRKLKMYIFRPKAFGIEFRPCDTCDLSRTGYMGHLECGRRVLSTPFSFERNNELPDSCGPRGKYWRKRDE